ncbi:hypothetical protein BDZ89DRAFT_747514 [Hymenopellis radicata]|nr:hypothetical protein BDZ89DRAFT_747514 [Hymenopellis radicata]
MPYLPDGRLRLFHDTLAGLVPMLNQTADMGDIAAGPTTSSTAPDGGRFDEPYAPGPDADQYEPEAFGGQSKDVPHPESPLPSELPSVAPFIEREEVLPRPTWNDLPMHLRLSERVRKTFRTFQQPRGRGLEELHLGSFFNNRESSDYPDVALMKSITIDTLPATTVEQIELLAESLAHTAHETRDPVRLQEISIRIHDDNGHAGAELADAPSWRHMAALLGEARFAHLTLNVMVYSPNAEHLGRELEDRLQQIMPEGALTVYVSSPDQSSTSSR